MGIVSLIANILLLISLHCTNEDIIYSVLQKCFHKNCNYYVTQSCAYLVTCELLCIFMIRPPDVSLTMFTSLSTPFSSFFAYQVTTIGDVIFWFKASCWLRLVMQLQL